MLLQEFNARLSHGYFKSIKNRRNASGDMLMPMRREIQRMGIDWQKEEWNSSKALV